MPSLTLHTDRPADHTLVPDVFLDKYMPTADGEYVKVYLYLLRCLKAPSKELSLTVIAETFDQTPNAVRRALAYWEKAKLLRLEYNQEEELSGICLLEEQSGAPVPSKEQACLFVPPKAPPAEIPAPPAQAAKAAPPISQEELKQLLFICEQYLGKTLSSTDVGKILFFHEELGFSADLIEYLVEYCVTQGHKSIRYIETVAIAWHKEGYATVAQAKEQSALYGKAYYAILKAFGIKRRDPAEAELSYMRKWLKEYAFPLDLILEACNRTIAAIHQPSFEYADKILERWRSRQISGLSDLAELDAEHQRNKEKTEKNSAKKAAPNRFHNFHQRDYDYSELERLLINK